MTVSKYGCGPLYDQVAAFMDDSAPAPDLIIAMALRSARSWPGSDDDDGALAGHDN